MALVSTGLKLLPQGKIHAQTYEGVSRALSFSSSDDSTPESLVSHSFPSFVLNILKFLMLDAISS